MVNMILVPLLELIQLQHNYNFISIILLKDKSTLVLLCEYYHWFYNIL